MTGTYLDNIDQIIQIRGVKGQGEVRFPLLDWQKMSPARRVPSIHEARRDITDGKPFDVVSWHQDGKLEATCRTA